MKDVSKLRDGTKIKKIYDILKEEVRNEDLV